MSTFHFNHNTEFNAVLRAEVPAGIKNAAVLLDVLATGLLFPEYFGGNWDALGECIQDLSWLPPGDIILQHEDLPLAEDKSSLSIYLSILKAAVDTWSKTGSNLIFVSPEKWDASGERALLVRRKLFIVFPSDTRRIVESILQQS
jgi:hypothetical protein